MRGKKSRRSTKRIFGGESKTEKIKTKDNINTNEYNIEFDQSFYNPLSNDVLNKKIETDIINYSISNNKTEGGKRRRTTKRRRHRK